MSAESNALGNINEFLRTIPYAITGQWFYAQNIFLDGFSFTRCRFDGCNVYLARGMFVLDHCYFHNCTFFYTDETLASIRLFVGNHVPNTVNLIPHLRPIINADGTVSVDKVMRA